MADRELVAAHLGILWNSLSPEQQAAAAEARMDPADPSIPLIVWTHRLLTQMLALNLTVLSVKIQLAKDDPRALLDIVDELEK